MASGYLGSIDPASVPQPPTWNDSSEEVARLADEFIQQGKAFDDKLAAIKNPTIENFLKPLIDFENESAVLLHRLGFYNSVSTDPEVRKASNEASKRISEYGIEASLREDLFLQTKKIYESNKGNKALDSEISRYLEKEYRGYTRKGLELPLEERQKVEKLSKELSDLSIEYSKNLNEQTEYLLFTQEELEGVPENVIAQFDIVDGKYKVTYKYPDIIPVTKYAKRSSTRKQALLGNQNKVPQNAGLLKQAVVKRAELAKVLGYKNYADYVLEERMAKNSENVLDFEHDLLNRLKSKGETEAKRLEALKLKEYESQGLDTTSEEANTLYLWDFQYYHNLLLQQEYQVDEQKISEYFPLEPTIAKMLGFYETLFSLKFLELTENKRTWHEEVKQISVWKVDDPASPEFLGWIYFDLHPRDGKYGHAAHFTIQPGYYDAKKDMKVRPVSALVCNFSKPQKDKPALLKHSEVKTFFHELGHGIHALVSDVKLSRFHGTRVSRDFVECPSQMLEFWTSTGPELAKLSQHHKTGAPLDSTLIDAMVKSKTVDEGLLLLRQLHFGLFDMTLHTSADGQVDVDAAWDSLREDISLTSIGGERTLGYGSFGHMMGGYAAGYYGYLYSKVFATDIYYTIFKDDPFNAEKGRRYRDTVLRRGGSVDETEFLRELLGREPNSDAFLDDIGINRENL